MSDQNAPTVGADLVETIVAAALLCEGEILTLPAPARHGDIMSKFTDKVSYATILPEEQGFLTSTGRFVTRQRAAYVAMRAEQIMQPKWGMELYSEDLW